MPRPARRRPAPRSGDRGFGACTVGDLDVLTARAGLTPGQRLRTRAAAAVLGFRTTSYVTSELIDWSAAPGDVNGPNGPAARRPSPAAARRAWR
jgi:hypothetical protein